MSELEKARAGVILSILVLTLTWLTLSNSGGEQEGARAVEPVVLCASTHGAICDVTEDAPGQSASSAGPGLADAADLGEIVVSASRLPAPLGYLVVTASRLPEDPFAKVRLARAKDEDEKGQSVVR